MLIKAAEGRQSDVEALTVLLARPDLDGATRRRVEQELRTTRSGAKGEHDAAYEIELYFGESRNWVTIHDLRIEHNGFVAQIDHLIIDRLLEVWVCESKHVAQGVSIDNHGEWSRYYNGRKEGMASPIEQNNRHILLLQRVVDAGLVWLPSRLGFSIKPVFRNVVLLSNSARIDRPRRKLNGLDWVIKTEQLKKRLFEGQDEIRAPRFVARVVGQETIERFARSLVALHRPAVVDWSARFGLGPLPAAATPAVVAPRDAQTAGTIPVRRNSGLRCSRCGEPVSYAVAKFCWVNKARFGGSVYCMRCQQLVGRHPI